MTPPRFPINRMAIGNHSVQIMFLFLLSLFMGCSGPRVSASGYIRDYESLTPEKSDIVSSENFAEFEEDFGIPRGLITVGLIATVLKEGYSVKHFAQDRRDHLLRFGYLKKVVRNDAKTIWMTGTRTTSTGFYKLSLELNGARMKLNRDPSFGDTSEPVYLWLYLPSKDDEKNDQLIELPSGQMNSNKVIHSSILYKNGTKTPSIPDSPPPILTPGTEIIPGVDSEVVSP